MEIFQVKCVNKYKIGNFVKKKIFELKFITNIHYYV